MQVVLDDRMVIGVPVDDPWPESDAVTLAELGERAVVSLPVGTGLRGAFDGACAAAGAAPRIAFESSDLGVVADLAAQGMGVAVLPASVAAGHPGLRGVPVEPETRSQLALAWRTGGPSSPAGRALVAHARAVLPALG